MKDSFTLNDLILFSNGDGSKSDDEMIDEYCRVDVDELAGPDKRIVDNILSYSRALSVIKTKRIGNVNVLMN